MRVIDQSRAVTLPGVSFPEHEGHRGPHGQPMPPQPPTYHPPHSAPPYPGYPVSAPPGPPAKRPMSTAMALLWAGGISLVLIVGGLAFVAISGRSFAPPRSAAPVYTPPADRTTEAPTSVAPSVATMIDVVGKNAAVAGDELKRAGFTEVSYGSVDVGETVLLTSNWWVAEQSHKAGQILPADTLIVLGCTKQRP